jgi:glycerol uptake facilitator-like aquaporin
MIPGEISPVSGEIVLNRDQAVSRMEAVTPMTTEAGSMPSLAQRLFSEWLGTAFLLAAVVGAGIMAAKLTGGNGAVALLCNTLATGAIWVVLILVFGSTSGAHFNPAVSLAFALRGALPWRDAALYIVAQLVGGTVGVWAAHGMFELPLWQFSVMARTGTGQWLAETIATFGLILTIFGCLARTPSAISFAVGLYVTSASWFTASGSFANPAVTIARSLSDTFAGIAPAGVLAFIIAQVAGMLLAVALAVWLWPNQQVWGRTCSDGRRSSDRGLT